MDTLSGRRVFFFPWGLASTSSLEGFNQNNLEIFFFFFADCFSPLWSLGHSVRAVQDSTGMYCTV